MARKPTLVHQCTSALGTLFVVDADERRHLRIGSIDGLEQSVVSLTQADEVQVEYIREAFVALALAPPPSSVLMIGLGGGVFSTRLRKAFPKARIDAVEVSPEVADIATRYFGVREDARLRIHIDDGLAFVARSRRTYDLALLDAYSGNSIPAHLGTASFFAAVARRMQPKGVTVLNIAIDDPAQEHALIEAFRTVFPHGASLRTPTDDNVLLFGSATPLIGQTEAQLRAKRLTRDLDLEWRLHNVAARLDYTCRSAFSAVV